MKRPMIIMLVIVVSFFALIFAYHTFGHFMMMRFFSSQANPAQTVSTVKVKKELWKPVIRTVGTVRAIQGVNVTTELAGMVQKIYFTPGSEVQAGQVLVQLNADQEIAQLHALEANLSLANINYKRDKLQLAANATSKAVVDTTLANLQNVQAQADAQKAIIAKKTITAPFSGRLGISLINLGQYLNVGDAIVTLQTEDPIFVDFYVPQQTLPKLLIGQNVSVISDVYAKAVFNGKLTTINPLLSTETRNVEAEATVSNPTHLLKPGMFVTVEVDPGKQNYYLTLPQTAISFNSYGEIVYVVTEKKDEKDKDGKPLLIANQTFVVTGDTRGDQIAVLKGIQENDVIVTSGQLKLKNGTPVKVNNAYNPSNKPNPLVPNDHIN